MAKRKVFIKTDLSAPTLERTVDAVGRVSISLAAIPAANTRVRWSSNATAYKGHDFGPWYGVGIDEITAACQHQIERFLAKQDKVVEASSVAAYCKSGVNYFLDCLAVRAAALQRRLTLADIGREAIDGFLGFLRDGGLSTPSQKALYDRTKTVLRSMGERGLIQLVERGDAATFPYNPFPGSNRKCKGQKPLPKAQRKAFTAAVKTEVMDLMAEDAEPTSDLLAYALLLIALHTGRNTTPLLEMPVDCLRAHPKEDTVFLVLWKRRGHNTSKVALRADLEVDRGIESTPTLRMPVVRLIRRVIALTAPLRAEAPKELKNRVWLYRSLQKNAPGRVTALNDVSLGVAIRNLIKFYRLVDTDSKPLRINVSRLRKTFVNRIYEILDGDLAMAAIAAGNTPVVASVSYLRPGEDAQKNWKFLGEVLVNELLTRTLGATERTPAGRCSDPQNGQYSPKRDGATCMAFLNCLRCSNYVVTGDDLYRLFSFYWRVLRERDRMDKRKWDKHYAHIPRLIDRDVVEPGIERKIFKLAEVEAARDRARHDPHPFWRADSILSLEALA